MLVSLTLSIAGQWATSSTGTRVSQGLTVALTELNIGNSLPTGVHIVSAGSANDAGLVASRHKLRVELYDLLRKWIHPDSQHGNDSTD
jgi:hypothetical protein